MIWTYHGIDPVMVHLGPVAIHWYGVMYMLGFVGAWWLAQRRRHHLSPTLTKDDISDLIFYSALGVVLGGRIGYMVFYGFHTLLADPLALFRIWEGGMSFHGGCLGVFVGGGVFARKHGLTWFAIMDFVAPFVPIGLGTGRLGNFINGELWGRLTDGSWGVVFPHVDQFPRHPSQLYECILEGVVLFTILMVFSSKPRPKSAVSALFLIGYGSARFVVEWFREPDAHLGLLSFGLSMGQWLSLPMIIFGVMLMFWAYRSSRKQHD